MADRTLSDLSGVGRATLEDFRLLQVRTLADLAAADPDELYKRLCVVTGLRHDVCCLDVFRCVVAQARDPDLPVEQRNWWFWSRRRKQQLAE